MKLFTLSKVNQIVSTIEPRKKTTTRIKHVSAILTAHFIQTNANLIELKNVNFIQSLNRFQGNRFSIQNSKLIFIVWLKFLLAKKKNVKNDHVTDPIKL